MLAAEAGGPEFEYRAPYEKQAVCLCSRTVGDKYMRIDGDCCLPHWPRVQRETDPILRN